MARLFRRHGNGETPSIDTARRELEMFIDAAEPFAGRPPPGDPVVDEGLHLFYIGAAEYLSRYHHLDDGCFVELAGHGLRHAGVPAPEANRTLLGMRRLLQHSAARDAMKEGAATMRNWFSGKDNNAPLRLAELICEWREAGPRH